MKNVILFVATCLTTLFSAVGSHNLDGCKNFGDACINLKTGRAGYCFPNYALTPPGSLSCDYKSDVLSTDEVLSLIIERYCASGRTGEAKRAAIKKSYRTAKAYKVLQKIFEIVGRDPVNVLKDERITELRKELSQVLRREASLPHLGLIVVEDHCYYIGDECVCPMTGRKGTCSATRRPNKDEIKIACLCE